MRHFRRQELPFVRAIRDLQLPDSKKQILIERYSSLVNELKERTHNLTVVFHAARVVVTVGSLIVPALLSIQSPTAGSTNVPIYWSTWTISLLVTMCNGLLTLFKVDKQYYYLHTVRELLISDGWQYIELTGKYSGFHTPNVPPTHENQFVYFCHSVEKIRMRQIQDEYYKVADAHTSHPNTGGEAVKTDISQAERATLIPPTPLKADLAIIPEELRKMLSQLSMHTVDGINTIVSQKGAKEEDNATEGGSVKDGDASTVSV